MKRLFFALAMLVNCSAHAYVWGVDAHFLGDIDVHLVGSFTEQGGKIVAFDIGELFNPRVYCMETFPRGSCAHADLISPTHLLLQYSVSPFSTTLVHLLFEAPLSQGGTIGLVPGGEIPPPTSPGQWVLNGSEYRFNYAQYQAPLISGSITAGVPEPSIYLLIGAGLILVASRMIRQRCTISP